MSTEVQPQSQPHPASPGAWPPAPRWSKRNAALIGMVVVIGAGILVTGTLPRLRRRAVLAADVQQVRTAIPAVTVITPRLVSEGGLSLPGNIQALKESAINARTTGYLRRLYVDIGSRVKAGQVLADIESPDVDQQVYQAMAQTAQSRATVGQSRAQVAQQRATVAQTRAQVAQQRAVVEQSRAQLASSLSSLAQQQAAERQSEAQLAHSNQQLDVQRASLKQAQAQLEFATVSNERYQTLVKQGFDTQQDADQAAATLKTAAAGVASAEAAVQSAEADVAASQQAVAASQAVVASAEANVRASRKSVQAAEAALASSEATVRAAQASVQASQSNVQANQATVTANQANTRRYAVMRSFSNVIAPFDGVITARNVDVGALINAGGGGGNNTVTTPTPSAGMLGIARTDQVRIQISVPQTYVPALRSHSTAQVTVREIPGRTFTGSVALRSGALDTFSRTQRVEVILPNPDRSLVPGMYAQVRVTPTHPPASLQIPGTALVINAQGTRVASVTPEGRAHFLKVQVGRDFGTTVEIVSGLPAGAKLVDNPPDTLAEGDAVKVLASQSPPPSGGPTPVESTPSKRGRAPGGAS
jgi:RND family efflux transporter MFP subunit